MTRKLPPPAQGLVSEPSRNLRYSVKLWGLHLGSCPPRPFKSFHLSSMVCRAPQDLAMTQPHLTSQRFPCRPSHMASTPPWTVPLRACRWLPTSSVLHRAIPPAYGSLPGEIRFLSQMLKEDPSSILSELAPHSVFKYSSG